MRLKGWLNRHDGEAPHTKTTRSLEERIRPELYGITVW